MMTEMKALYVLLTATALACMTACSVREDRGGCPAWITVCSDGYVADGYEGELQFNLSTELRSIFNRAEYPLSEFEHKGSLVFEVPRAEKVFVDIFGGVSRMRNRSAGLLIARGDCCDSIYAGHADAFIDGDEGMAAIPLNKSFANLRIHVINNTDDMERLSDFKFVIHGDVDGYCIPGGAPHKGIFEYTPDVGEDSEYLSARLPRQLNSSLTMDVLISSDGSMLTDIPLGELIANMDYDWSEPDLEDIRLEIKLEPTAFTLTIEGWGKTETIYIDL